MGIRDGITSRVLDLAMRHFDALRPASVAAASGRVLEVGFGTGLNLPHYGPGVTSLVGVDPLRAEGLKGLAQRLEAAPFPVERAQLRADASLPFDYFAEPKSLAANDFFGNKIGQERPETSSDRPGFTLSGPVRIPGLYDGRDKTFFTVGYEHIKDVRPRIDAGADSWVPTEALPNGDFSAYAGNITIYDPLTRVPSGNAFVGQPFPGNMIPAHRISPVSRAILEYYSLPKNPGLNGNIYDSTLPETADYSSFTGRLDQKISK